MTNGSVISKGQMWTGRVLSTLAVLFLLMDAVLHILKPAPVIDAFQKLGYPLSTAVPIGVLMLVCLVLYVIPKTSVLGAVLLTGYLGGAVATHVRVGDPMFSTVLFPVCVAGLVWGGLLFRDARARSIFSGLS